jgi:hypothetical protein
MDKESFCWLEKVIIYFNFKWIGYYWNMEDGLFVEFQFNPSSKNRRFFGGTNNQSLGDSQLHDYYEGTLKKYKK